MTVQSVHMFSARQSVLFSVVESLFLSAARNQIVEAAEEGETLTARALYLSFDLDLLNRQRSAFLLVSILPQPSF